MKTTWWILGGLAVAIAIALFLGPMAASSPDGLEASMEQAGLGERLEGEAVVEAPLPGYTAPGVENEKASTAIAGVAGTLATFGVMGLGAWLLVLPKRRRQEARDSA